MSEQNISANLLQEYVLDLLPPSDNNRLAEEIGRDAAALRQVQQERRVERLVKETVQQVGTLENGRLKQLMPAVPRQKRPFWHSFAPRQLATAALLFILMLGGWQWFNGEQSGGWHAAPTVVAATATMTYTPAATETQHVPTETAVTYHTRPDAILTPSPPTPVAAVPINTN